KFGDVVVQVRNFSPTSIEALVPAGPPGPVPLTLLQPGTAPVTIAAAVIRGDRTPPALVSAAPIDPRSFLPVPRNSVFTLVFSEPLAPASVTTTSIRLAPNPGTDVPIALSLSADARSVTVTPAQLLASTTAYAFVFHGISDPAGNVTPDFRLDFRTVDDVPPTIDVLYAGVSIVDGQKFAAGIDWH